MACNPPVSLDSMKLGSIYIHPELMGEVKLVKFTPYMVILDGGSVWKFWPYWSIFSWNQPYMYVCRSCSGVEGITMVLQGKIKFLVVKHRRTLI